jgi:hypothetical protein
MECIMITVHDGEAPAQRTTASVTDPIQVLSSSVPGGTHRLIVFRGYVLMAGFTFKFHGIKDGDDVYIVRLLPANRASAALAQRNWPRGAEAGARGLTREAGRLADLAQRRTQIRDGAIERIDADALPETVPTVTHQTGALTNVSTDPLPKCWT